MSKSKMKEDFRKMAKWSIRKMAKWSIRKMFENYPDETISLKELKTQLEFAWDELVEDEEIEAPGEGFINE